MDLVPRLTSQQVWENAGRTSARTHMPRVVTPWQVDRDVHGRIECCDVGPVRLARIRVRHQLRVDQRREGVRPGSESHYKLLLLISGRTSLSQDGRQVTLGAGDWLLYRGNEAFELENLEQGEQRMVMLPESELSGTGSIDQLVMRRYGTNDRSSKNLVSLLDSAFDIVALYGGQAAAQLAGAAIHLSRLALLENGGVAGQPLLSDVMRGRVKNFIDRNLRDPDLSLDVIARALNCSKRYLHKVFAHDEMSVAEYIVAQRLEKCFVELSHSSDRHNSIADLAYGWGFKSLSHFSRAFAKRYGMPPGDRRRTCLRALE